MKDEEPDDNTLDNAGPEGCAMADHLTQYITDGLERVGPKKQRAAIGRIIANNLYDFIEKLD